MIEVQDISLLKREVAKMNGFTVFKTGKKKNGLDDYNVICPVCNCSRNDLDLKMKSISAFALMFGMSWGGYKPPVTVYVCQVCGFESSKFSVDWGHKK